MNSCNHYDTLEVSQTASAKEIKAAFYRLSKKYHPDTKNDSKSATEKFTQIAAAYEVLASNEKRRLYDIQIQAESLRGSSKIPTHGFTAANFYPPQHQRHPKEYTDLDIDYKDFEHFQRESRWRRTFGHETTARHRYANRFRDTNGRTETDAWESYAYATYKDKRAMAREQQEKKLYAEIEKMRQNEQYPLPSFEEMLRHKNQSRLPGTTPLGRLFTVIFGGLLFAVAIGRNHSNRPVS